MENSWSCWRAPAWRCVWSICNNTHLNCCYLNCWYLSSLLHCLSLSSCLFPPITLFSICPLCLSSLCAPFPLSLSPLLSSALPPQCLSSPCPSPLCPSALVFNLWSDIHTLLVMYISFFSLTYPSSSYIYIISSYHYPHLSPSLPLSLPLLSSLNFPSLCCFCRISKRSVSKRFLMLLEVILALGNLMNGGIQRGNVAGFSRWLTSPSPPLPSQNINFSHLCHVPYCVLPLFKCLTISFSSIARSSHNNNKMGDTKSNDRNITLLRHFAQLVSTEFPGVSQWFKEIPAMELARNGTRLSLPSFLLPSFPLLVIPSPHPFLLRSLHVR